MTQIAISSNESGQSILELALSLPLFLILILGGTEIANLAWASVQVNNAAHAGADFASLSRTNAANISAIRSSAQNEAPLIITSPATQVTTTQVCTCVSNTGTQGSPDNGCTTTNLTSCASPSSIDLAVQVNISASVRPIIHYPGLPASYTLNAQATVGVE